MAIHIGYVTEFKLGNKVKVNSGEDIILTIKAIRLDPAEGGNGVSVLYSCGWFLGGIPYENWFPAIMLKEVK